MIGVNATALEANAALGSILRGAIPESITKQSSYGLPTISFAIRRQVNERDLTTMSIRKSDDENIPTDTEAYYEAIASQEEIYLEEVEEELRAILILGDPPPSQRDAKRSFSDANNDACMAKTLDEEVNRAPEELITGDSDDPPLSEEAVAEVLRISQIANGFDRIHEV